MKKDLPFLAQAALIAALYAAVTLLLAPITYGLFQVRVSEGLLVLAFYTPAAVPGITAGCFISGLLGPNGPLDAVIGSIASFIGVYFAYKMRSNGNRWLALMPNVIANGVIIGLMLHYVFGVPVHPLLCILAIAAGEFVSCMFVGLPLDRLLYKHRDSISWMIGHETKND